VTGHTTPSCFFPVRSSTQVGGAILCRRDTALRELALLQGAVLHRALRAGCLTGCRAETPVSRAVYPDYFARATHSFPVATLRNQGAI
jgi:hypothetical protein